MRKILIFCLICIIWPLNAQEIEGTYVGLISVTYKWYDNVKWSWSNWNYTGRYPLYYAEVTYILDFEDKNFTPVQIERWRETTRRGDPPVEVKYEGTNTVITFSFPWPKGGPNPFLNQLMAQFGWEGRIPLSVKERFVKGFRDSHNALDPDFVYDAVSEDITGIDDFELRVLGQERESPEYVNYNVIYKIYRWGH